MGWSLFRVFLLIFFVLPSHAFSADSNALSGKVLLLKYEDDQNYHVKFDDVFVTWTCVKGAELGKVETDIYQIKRVAPHVYLVNWSEVDGSFVDLVLNLKLRKVYSSGKSGELSWFREGAIESADRFY